MAITNNGTKWEIKNSWFFSFLLFLPLNCICFFIMNGRVPKRQYIVKAFLCIFSIIILLFSVFLSNTIKSGLLKEYPDNRPQIYDYLGYGYTSIENYEDTDEYKAYLKAKDDYESSEEYKEVFRYNSNVRNTVNAVTGIIIPVSVLLFLLLMSITCFFIDRPKYLRELSDAKNKNKVISALKENNNNSRIHTGTIFNSQNNSEDTLANNSKPVQMLDINNMSEEDFLNVQLLNIVDVKNIINYRNKNGEFTSLEQFFISFNAKPHVIAKLSDLVEIGGQKNSFETTSSGNKGSRKFDI